MNLLNEAPSIAVMILCAGLAASVLLSEEPPNWVKSGAKAGHFEVRGEGSGTLSIPDSVRSSYVISLPSSHIVSMGPEWRGPRSIAHCLECGCIRWWVGRGYLYGPCDRHEQGVSVRWGR